MLRLTQMPSSMTFTVFLKLSTSCAVRFLSWSASSLATKASAWLFCVGVPPHSVAAAKTMVAAAYDEAISWGGWYLRRHTDGAGCAFILGRKVFVTELSAVFAPRGQFDPPRRVTRTKNVQWFTACPPAVLLFVEASKYVRDGAKRVLPTFNTYNDLRRIHDPPAAGSQ